MVKIPWYQRWARLLLWMLGGTLALGSALDALINSQAIFSVRRAQIASLTLVVLYLVAAQWVRRTGGFQWVVDGEPHRITRLGRQPLGFLLGAILLIWVPSLLATVGFAPAASPTQPAASQMALDQIAEQLDQIKNDVRPKGEVRLIYGGTNPEFYEIEETLVTAGYRVSSRVMAGGGALFPEKNGRLQYPAGSDHLASEIQRLLPRYAVHLVKAPAVGTSGLPFLELWWFGSAPQVVFSGDVDDAFSTSLVSALRAKRWIVFLPGGKVKRPPGTTVRATVSCGPAVCRHAERLVKDLEGLVKTTVAAPIAESPLVLHLTYD